MSLCWSCLQFLCHFLSSGRIHMKWNHNSKETHVWISTMQARPVSKCLKMLRFFLHMCSYLLGTHVECVCMCSPCSSMVLMRETLRFLHPPSRSLAAARPARSCSTCARQRRGPRTAACWLHWSSHLVGWFFWPSKMTWNPGVQKYHDISMNIMLLVGFKMMNSNR